MVFCVCRDGSISVNVGSCLGRRTTPQGKYAKIAAAMMRLAAQDYRAAAAELKHQGIEVTYTLHQKVQAWSSGESVSDYIAEALWMSVSGGMSVVMGARRTHLLDGFKVGSIGKDYPHQNATSVENPPTTVCRLPERCGGFSPPTRRFSNADRHLSRRKNDRRRRSRCEVMGHRGYGTLILSGCH